MKRYGKRILAGLLAIVIGLGVLPPVQAHAATHIHTDYDVLEFIYERRSDAEGDIDTYAICGGCKERYLYHSSGRREHSWSQAEVANTTCTTDGYYILECQTCHAKEKTITYKATGHRFGDWKVVKEAACLEAGERQHECEECHTVEKEAIPAKGAHSFGEWKVLKEASCTEAGEREHTCAECSTTEKEQIPAKGTHSFGEWKVLKEATCAEAGEREHTCTECDATEKEEIPATGDHKWSDWKTLKEAVCLTPGEREHTCGVCNATQKEQIPAIGTHNWGEWKVTTPAGHGVNGEETRECSRCKETETRPVESKPLVTRNGEYSLAVQVTQQLLAYFNEFGGSVNGIFGDDLADALRAWEKTQGLTETGEIYPDTLQLLTERYMADFGEALPRSGLLHSFDSGIMSSVLLEDHCTTNGDGTHENEPVAIGVRYLMNSEDLTVTITQEHYVSFEKAAEACFVNNESRTCIKCGYQDDSSSYSHAALRNLLAINGGTFTMTTYDLDIDPELPEVPGIVYQPELDMIEWGILPDAYYHTLTLSTPYATEPQSFTGLGDSFDDVSEYVLYQSVATVQAFDMDDNPVSRPTEFSFFSLPSSEAMPTPDGVWLQYGNAVWAYSYAWNLNPVFRVTLNAFIPGAGGQDEIRELYTCETSDYWCSLFDVYAKYSAFPPSTRLQVSVVATDPEGHRADSEEACSEAVYYQMPLLLKARATVNVRSGPGMDYERIGSLSKGSTAMCWETHAGVDGTYYVITYGSNIGCVSADAFAWFTPKDFSVMVDLGDGRTEMVRVNMDGTLNRELFEQKIKKTGYRVRDIVNPTIGENRYFDWDKELTPDTKLAVSWEPDPAYVLVTFHNTNGDEISFTDPDGAPGEITAYPVALGSRLPSEVLSGIGSGMEVTDVHFWTLDPEGTGAIVNKNTKFTAEMTDVYRHGKGDAQETITVGGNILRPRVRGSMNYRLILADTNLDANTEVLGELREGDRLKLLQKAGDGQKVSFVWEEKEFQVKREFYKVFSYRLNRECYVFSRNFDIISTDAVTVYFDANGGWCPVTSMTAEVQRGYGYPTILEMPYAAKDGCTFAGWVDASGEIYREGSDFTNKSRDRIRNGEKIEGRDGIYLTAKWEKHHAEYPKKHGVIVPQRYTDPRMDVFYSTTPDSDERLPIPAGKEVTIIGETPGSYQCLCDGQIIWLWKENVRTDLQRYDAYRRQGGMYIYRTPGGGDIIGWLKSGTYYIVGTTKKGYTTVLFDPESVSDIQDGEAIRSGYGWAKEGVALTEAYQQHRVIFDPGRGYCAQKETTVESGLYSLEAWKLGFDPLVPDWYIEDLPEAFLPGHKFEGWYTDPVGGELVTSSYEITKSMTLYAHYTDAYHAYRMVTRATDIYDKQDYNEYQNAKVIGSLKPGEVVVSTGSDATWCQISHRGINGWVPWNDVEKKVTRMIASPQPNINSYIKKKPAYDSKLYRKVREGEVIFVTGETKGNYVQIAFPESNDGYAWVLAPILREP